MEKEQSKWSKYIEKLGTEYRLSILQEETFEQLTNYKLPLWKMIGAVGVAGLLTVILTLFLVIYTPLNGPVLNYVNKIETTDIVVLNQKIAALENQVESYQTIHNAMRTMLGGESENLSLPNNLALPQNKNSGDSSLVSDPKPVLMKNNRPKSISVNLLPPINGNISASFMPEKGHYGVDIVAPKNTPVKAVMDGIVIQAAWTIETGNTIGVQHSDGYITYYKHNSSMLKKAGSPVKAGEAIAIIGNTGDLTDGPHLHFELWHNGQPIDPVRFISF